MKFQVGVFISISLLTILSIGQGAQKPSVVKLKKTANGYRLFRNGAPYFIKGAGGSGSLKELAARGGNSTRTWGFDGTTKYLDQAQKHGITVTSGLWLGHRRNGFDYGDTKSLWGLLNKAEKWIRRQRNHPALLIWAIGNEMEMGDENNPAVWYAINDIARLCKKLDPNHPTMTVVAELGGKKVQNIHRFCPNIDIIGINSYGGCGSVGNRYIANGGTKPYIITEFGPPGQWETGKTKWGAPHEMDSTTKAKWYFDVYKKSVLGHPGLCLGSYAFTWGWKVEGTPTWYGLFLPSGEALGAVEKLSEVWSGPKPTNRAPITSKITVSKDNGLERGEEFTASVKVTDPDGDAITVKWVLYPELTSYAIATHGAQLPPTFPKSIVKTEGQTATIKAPAGGGGYRLYAFAFDGKGCASQANIPIHVNGPPLKLPATKAKLPFALYGDKVKEMPYTPSGYMGDAKSMKVEQNSTDNPKTGKTCMKVSFVSDKGWGGVVWQNPPNDWGAKAGGFDLTGAKQLTFCARGATGNEKVTFGVGIIGNDQKFPDSDMASIKDITLTTQWKRYSIPLTGRNLTRIKSGFYWSLAGKVTFYLDEIRFE